MKAVILAGGKGTRLAPYTTVLPKPLMPVGDMPILEIMLRQLKNHGISDIVLCVGHLGSLLETYFGNGERWGLRIAYSYEKEPLGTAGPIGLIDGLDSTFLAMNGDLLTTIDYGALSSFHSAHDSSATVCVAEKEVKIDLGVIEFSDRKVITSYIEKPILKYKVSMGIYMLEPTVLDYIRGKGRLDFPDLVLKLVADGKAPMIFDADCRWLDIGRIDDYNTSNEIFERDRELFLSTGTARGEKT